MEKIDFDRDILHVKQPSYIISTPFKGYKYSPIHEFYKCFDLKCPTPPAPRIIKINWSFSSHNWISYNTNGVSRGNPCGGIFKDNLETFKSFLR